MSPIKSQPVLWWELIEEVEDLRRRTGWSFGVVWGHIHSEDYKAARARLDYFYESEDLEALEARHKAIEARRRAS